MSKSFIENNVHVSGGAWVAVEWFFCRFFVVFCENYKMGEFLFSVFDLSLLVEVFGCIKTLKGTSWAYNEVKCNTQQWIYIILNGLYFTFFADESWLFASLCSMSAQGSHSVVLAH